jgi:hypothetical protein
MMVTSWTDNDGQLHTTELFEGRGETIVLRCEADEESVLIPVDDWPSVRDGINALYERAMAERLNEGK